MRTGEPYKLEEGSEAHRAKVARGPTSMADLEAESAKHQEEGQKQEVQEQDTANKPQAGAAEQDTQDSSANAGIAGQDVIPNGTDPSGFEQQQQQGQTSSSQDPAPSFIPAQSFQGSKPGYAFQTGPQGLGYYVDAAADGMAQEAASSSGRAPASSDEAAPDASKTSTSSTADDEKRREQVRGHGDSLGCVFVELIYVNWTSC